MKTLKGWHRYTPLKAKINKQLAVANSDERLASIAKRCQVVEQAIRTMNQNNGAFLDKPKVVALYTIEQMKAFQQHVLKGTK